MQASRKQLPTDSPRKIQTDMTSFAGKHSDNKNTPNRSYAQVTSGNRFEALSDHKDQKDEEMENAFSSDSSDATPRQGNTKTKDSIDTNKIAHLSNPLSRKSQRKISKAARKNITSKVSSTQYLPSATKATLERARKAKESLSKSTNEMQGESSEATETNSVGEDTSAANFTNDETVVETMDQQKEVSDTSSKVQADTAKTPSLESTKQSSSSEASAINNNRDNSSQAGDKSHPNNPYARSQRSSQGILHAIPQRPPRQDHKTSPRSIDKQISLKKGMLRPHIHRYTLRIKIISSRSEEDE
jgi:hypothetical protein